MLKKQLLINNSIIGLVQFVLTAILTLISIPIFINILGLELYSIFALISVIGNLKLLTDLGLNKALIVYLAKQGKCKESDFDVAITILLMTLIMFLFVLIIIVFRVYIIESIFSVPKQYYVESELLLIYLVLANSFLLLGQTFTAVIDATQKIYLTNICQFIYSLIYWGGIIIIVSSGGGLVSVGIMALIASITWFIIVFIIYRNIWGSLDLKGLRLEFRNVVNKQISYGSKIYISGLVAFMFEPLSKILLSNFIGLNAVGYFEIGTKIRGQIKGVLFKVLYPFFPFIAQSKDDQKLKFKVFDLSKKIQLFVIPLSILIVFTLPILIKLWLGIDNYEEISLFAIALTVPVLMFSPPILPIYQYLMAKNMADRTIWIQLSSVLINLVAFLALYKVLGIYSILISNGLGYLASYALGSYYQFKYLQISLANELVYYLKLISFAFLGTIICLAIRYYFDYMLWDLLIYPIVIGIFFLIYIRETKLISNDDLERYFATMPYFKKRLNWLLKLS